MRSVEWEELRGNLQSSICFWLERRFDDITTYSHSFTTNVFSVLVLLYLLVHYVGIELLGLLDGREEVQQFGIWGHCPLDAVVRRQRMRLLVNL